MQIDVSGQQFVFPELCACCCGRADSALSVTSSNLYGRTPRPEELAIGLKFLGQGEPLARWESYCQVLLCANEMVFVD